MRFGVHGQGYFVIEFTLVSRAWRQIAEIREKVSRIALSKKGAIYVSCGPSVYRVKGGN